MQEKKTLDGASASDMSEKQLCSELTGRRILFLGCDEEAVKAAVRVFRFWKKQQKASFEILEQTETDQNETAQIHEVRPGDFVILVCSTNGDPWKNLIKLSGLMEDLRKSDPASLLLLSDTGVYGKLFGAIHALKEDELGYVCHTDPGDGIAQCMRTMENLCSRLGREEGFPVKIVRADRSWIMNPEIAGQSFERVQEQLAYHMSKVMLKGMAGEVYNLPGAEELKAAAENPGRPFEAGGLGQGFPDRSPLSPIPIIPDAGKAGRL